MRTKTLAQSALSGSVFAPCRPMPRPSFNHRTLLKPPASFRLPTDAAVALPSELSRALYLEPRAACLPRALLASSVQLSWWVPVLWRRLRALELAVAERSHSQSAQRTTGASRLGVLTARFENHGAAQSHALCPRHEVGRDRLPVSRPCWPAQDSASVAGFSATIARARRSQ